MMKTFTKNSAKTKFASLAFLLILSLQILQIAKVHAQVSGEQRIANTVKIINVEAINESRIGLIDGKIIVSIEDLNPQSSTYRLSYDLHSSGNNFISPILKSVNNKLTLSNARMGNYYNLKVIRNIDNEVSSTFGAFKVDNGSYIEGSISSNRTSTFCSNTMSYTDCAGTARTISNCNTGSAYNGLNNYRPCGVEIASQCSVFAISQWHCIDGNLSEPPSHNEFTPTNYIGAGLTALQASRINWIVCNYGCFDAGVDHAIWYIAGTGGTNNTIAQAAAAAVTVANGTELLMVFYKSLNGSYQDMVQWQCRTTSNCTCPNNLVTNPSFENGTNNWNWSGGNFNAGTGAVFCGNYSGDFEITNTSANWVSQTIGTDLPIGTVLSASVYAGTHDNSIAHSVQINFFDAAWNYVSAVVIPVNKVLSSAPAGPQLYTFTATVPANTKYTQAVFSGSGGWIKTDNWCVTSTPPAATGSIGDRVWGDANGNGIQDASETTPIVGVTVQLKNAAGTVIATTTTNATGNYLFSGLAAGNYKVVFPVSISGAVVTGANVGTDDNIDSDASQTTGETGTITLGSGQNITNVDAGYCPITLQLGNRVWNDVNNDGINNNGELGIATATVNLYIDNNNDNVADGAAIATTTTDANGFYNFANLGPGNYIVGVVTPAGFVSSSINGGDPDNDINLDDNGTLTVGNETRGSSITLVAGTEPDGTNTNTDNNITYDFGFYQTNIMNLGNVVWYDQNNNGTKDGIEPGLVGATVKLYADANNDNVADGAAIATTTTIANGVYNFTGLTPGNYIVGVTIPAGYAVVTTNGGDPDNNTDNDNNGTNTSVAGEVRSSAITLALTTEPTIDGDGNNGNLTVDFGFKGTGSISDLVFNDTNANGIQDAGEAGIPNATVVLTFADGTTSTTTTDANGLYIFPNLAPGIYSVAFTTPAGLTSSPSNQGANDAADSDPVGGTVAGIVLGAGQNNNTVDAGFYQANVMNLGNVVWYDQNNNGTKDGIELGIVGATVKLYADANNDNVADGAAIATTTTIANGVYNFSGLTPGNYIVGVTIPAGYAVVTTNGGDPDNNTDNDNNGTNTSVAGEVRSSAITLALTTEPTTDGDGNNGNLTVDFGFKGTGSISDLVFNDTNANGIQDAGEVGIPNATVVLTFADGTTSTTTTDGNGLYIFPNLAPGTYSVAFTTPAGLTSSPSNQGTNDAADSDPVGGTVAGIVLGAGQNNNTVDAGFYQANVMNLGNVVWYDQNNNGTKDGIEPGIVGATVKLYADANNDNVADGAAIATTTTIANGVYNFTGLTPGNYIVGVTIPAGYAVVTTNGGDPDNNTDNDNNGTNTSVAGEVRSSAITLALTTEPTTDGDGNNGNLTVDFGFKGTGSISDLVFNDTNANGIQDAGEVGIPNATVVLTFADGTTSTTTTDGNGLYIFPNLAPGTYSVTFTTPAGLTSSPSNQGANDAADSDPVGGTVAGIVLGAGQNNNTVDAGFYQANVMNLGNVVWYDQNNNGTKDGIEPGIVGATVKLYADANNDNVADGAAIATTTTIANGVYNFTGLTPGNYIVGVTIPAGYAVVTTNGGDPDNNTDNDNNGTNTSVAGEVRSSAITLALTTEPTTDGDGNNGNLTVDFGFTGTASIGDFVFFDTNANGVQDVTETAGVPNATVILTGPNGTTTTTTNASGIYNFPNLIPGTYTVTFTTPVGFNVSPSNVTIPGATDANDSDPVGGAVTGIVLTAGQINNTIDAGFYNCVPLNSGINGPTSICANEAAVFNATGAGSGSIYSWTFMSGTPATATGLNVSSTWTIPGEYDINLTVTKNGCTSNYLKSIAITQAVFANAGPDKDICSGSTATLGAGPSGPNGSGPANSSYNWTVIAGDPTSIINGANQSQALVAPTSTSTYQLTVTQGGCTRTDQITVVINVDKNPTANAGPNRTTLVGTPVVIGGSPTGIAPLATPGAALGYVWSAASGLNSTSIANPTATLTTAGTVNYRVIVFSVLTGCSDTSNMSITAIQPVNLGNNVWYDKNNNGIKDATEPAVVTTVNLYKDDNSDNVPDGAAIATTTSTGGVYNFANLYPGSYIVGAAIPNGYAPTATTANSANANSDIDNDNNAINIVGTEVRSNTVVLTAGGEPLTVIDADDNNGNLTVDFGFKGTASLGDFVWYDTDRDGIFDANEVGIANATVTLTYPDGSTLVTTTSATGSYNFANLISGSYNVLFSTPSGLKATLPNATGTGANDTNDSDPISGAVNGIVLSAGQVNNTIDAGFHNICSAVISGNVWHDIDEMTDNLVDSVGSSTALAIPNALNVSLVSNTTGLVVKTSLVSGNGRYAFLNVARGSYYIVLSTIPGAEGTTPPTAVLPTGWKNTGENLGTGPGRDLQINGLLNVAIGFECIANANFGIKFSNSGIGID